MITSQGYYIPDNQNFTKISSKELKDEIVKAALLKKNLFEEMFSHKSASHVAGIFLAKNWKRDLKEVISQEFREQLSKTLGPLPDELIYCREFRYDTAEISYIVAETYCTKDRILMICVEDQ